MGVRVKNLLAGFLPEVQKEWKLWFHSKSSGLLLFALLLSFLVVILPREGKDGQRMEPDGIPTGGEESFITLGVVDLEDDIYTRLLLEYFREEESFGTYVSMQTGTEEEIRTAFDAGQLDGWLKIPEGFVEGMISIEHLPMEITLSRSDLTKTVLLQNLFEVYGCYVAAVEDGCMTLYRQMEQAGSGEEQIDAANWQISMDLINAVMERSGFFRYEELVLQERSLDQISLGSYYGFALLGLLPFLLAVPGGLCLIGEQQNGVWKRLQSTGGGRVRMLLCRWLLQSGLTMAGILIMSGCLRRAAGRVSTGTELLLASLLTAVVVILVQMSALIIRRKQEYLLAVGLSIMILAILGGSLLPVRLLPDTMAAVTEWMPNRLLAVWLAGEVAG